MKNKSRMISLLKELIATNSENPPGKEKDVAKILQDYMESHGMSCIRIGSNDRPNLIFSTNDYELGPLVLHGHMDTVPTGNLEKWIHDPFTLSIIGNRIYGLGACDMKGPLTALTETMILYSTEKHEMPLLMLATSDEESGCTGAEAVAKSKKLEGVRYGVCAEPTDLKVLVGEKGELWSRIVANGKSAHGSRPEEGINAIMLLIKAIEIIQNHKYPFESDSNMGEPTLNVGKINGGVKINIVPDHCEALIDFRLVKGQSPEDILKIMNSLLEEAQLSDRVYLEYILGKPAINTPINSKIVKLSIESVKRVTGFECELKAASYGTDCSVLQPKIGITNVICGPGSIEQAHQPNEFITITQMLKSVDVYLNIAREFSS